MLVCVHQFTYFVCFQSCESLLFPLMDIVPDKIISTCAATTGDVWELMHHLVVSVCTTKTLYTQEYSWTLRNL